MSLDACAAKVAAGDPDRYRAAMTAPMPGRGGLMALYAFNLEVARAPWVTQEPMIAEMRLQWWADVLDEIAAGGAVRSHEVATPLTEAVRACGADVTPLRDLVEARRFDIYRDPHDDDAAFWSYLDATSGGLVVMAVRLLGGSARAEPVALSFGRGIGCANLIRGLPALLAHGRNPLPRDGFVAGQVVPETLARLARQAQAEIAGARGQRHAVPHAARPAFHAGWRAKGPLSVAARRPDRALTGDVAGSELSDRAGLVWSVLSGRW